MSAYWEVDVPAVTAAVRKLGIAYPVCIEPQDCAAGRLGGYVGVVPDQEHGALHLIHVTAALTVQQASDVIWHELAHALQAERCGGSHAYEAKYAVQVADAGLDYERFGDGLYLQQHYEEIITIPFEIEADKIEAENKTTLLTQQVTA